MTVQDTGSDAHAGSVDSLGFHGKSASSLSSRWQLISSRPAASARPWPGKPVIAVNTIMVGLALRQYVVADRIAGFGTRLAHH